MEGCITLLVAGVLGIFAGVGAHIGWWATVGVPAAALGWAIAVGVVVFILALFGIGILVIGD